MNKVADISSIPWELISSALLSLPYKDLMSACATNRNFRAICQSNLFWVQKLFHDFHVETLSSAAGEQYLQELSKNEAFRGCERYQNVQHCLLLAMKQLDDNLVNYFIQLGAKFEDLLIKPRHHLIKLRQTDPKVFWPNVSRIVHTARQPLVFDIDMLSAIKRYLYPHYVKNILIYNGHVYTTSLENMHLRPYVYLMGVPEGMVRVPGLYQYRNEEIPDIINIPELIMGGIKMKMKI